MANETAPKTTQKTAISYENAKAAFAISFMIFVLNGQLLTTHLQALTAVPPPATAVPPPPSPKPPITMSGIFQSHK
ncbi:hypothetical protein A2U01_0055080, partial [Trifolium medium]|nr:hypothetical protein [Trifolium medium]